MYIDTVTFIGGYVFAHTLYTSYTSDQQQVINIVNFYHTILLWIFDIT